MASPKRSAKAIHWQKVLEQYQRSGLSVRVFCDEKRIPPNSFYQWRRKLQSPSESSSNSIIPVKLVSAPPATAPPSHVVQIMTPNGFSIRLDSAMRSEELSTILRAISASTERGQ